MFSVDITVLRSSIVSCWTLPVTWSRSSPASETAEATVVATVVTKAELICSSMVVAPVSVIFGAIAFFFSLT